MKKVILLLIILGGLVFAKDVNAQVGCCTGSVVTGKAECPNAPSSTNWFCTETSTAYGCGGLDYSTCVNTRPDPFPGCGNPVGKCTGCGWSTTACGGGGGGGGNCSDVGVGCSSNNDCCSGRCSAQRGICVNEGNPNCPLVPVGCPVGTVRGSTVVSNQCLTYQCQNDIGSAQVIGMCCN